MPYLKESPKNISTDVINLISKEVSAKYKIVPFELKKDILKIATLNPKDTDVLNILRFIAEDKNLIIEEYFVSEEVFNQIFAYYEGTNEIQKTVIARSIL